LWSFLSGATTQSRTSFASQLEELKGSADDAESFLKGLLDLATSLHELDMPFELGMLRKVVGLGETCSVNVVKGIVCLAYDAVATQSWATQSTWSRALSVLPESASVDSPFGVDEATRLEAEEYFSSVVGFDPDPLGAKARYARALYRGAVRRTHRKK
jgi:hypothetical protein